MRPQKESPCVKPRHHVCLYNARLGQNAIARNNSLRIVEEKCYGAGIFHAYVGRPYSTGCDGSLYVC
jgi:hypothetical protein